MPMEHHTTACSRQNVGFAASDWKFTDKVFTPPLMNISGVIGEKHSTFLVRYRPRITLARPPSQQGYRGCLLAPGLSPVLEGRKSSFSSLRAAGCPQDASAQGIAELIHVPTFTCPALLFLLHAEDGAEPGTLRLLQEGKPLGQVPRTPPSLLSCPLDLPQRSRLLQKVPCKEQSHCRGSVLPRPQVDGSRVLGEKPELGPPRPARGKAERRET